MTNDTLPLVTVYTDGACVPNPGSGGWAAIIWFMSAQKGRIEKEITGSNPHTTSICMELQAAIEALKVLKRPCFVNIYTDSRYLYDGARIRLPRWKTTGWRLANGDTIKNVDLWKQLDILFQFHHVEFHWTKGHSDDYWNQKVDILARNQIQLPSLPSLKDGGYHLFIQTSCSNGSGGWGAVLRKSDEKWTFFGMDFNTTANRIEIVGAIEGLNRIPQNTQVNVYTRNNYIYSTMINNIQLWKKNGWRTSSSEEVMHRDLWEKLLTAQEGKLVRWYLFKSKTFLDESKEAKDLAIKKLRESLKE